MNRKQAENILDAYVLLSTTSKAASDSLREVILDAMTEYRVTTSSTTWPNTYSITAPNVISNKPIVTCDAGGAE